MLRVVSRSAEIEKFTLAELDAEEASLDRLQRWHEQILTRDLHGAEGSAQARSALEQAQVALDRYSIAVFGRTAP